MISYLNNREFTSPLMKTLVTDRIGRFTLVELLAIVVIVGIMVTMFIPMFDEMGAGRKVKSSAKLIAGKISLARQYAQGEGRYVGLMMPEASFYADIGDYACSAYRLCFIDYDGIDYEFDGWIEGTKWLFLPLGVSIMEADSDLGIVDSSGASPAYVKEPVDDNVTKVKWKDSQEATIFGPPIGNGSVSVTPNEVRAVIFAPSGKPRPVATNRYITVGEARYEGFWLIKNPGDATVIATQPQYTSCANQITLEINGFTAGMTYYTPDQYPTSP